MAAQRLALPHLAATCPFCCAGIPLVVKLPRPVIQRDPPGAFFVGDDGQVHPLRNELGDAYDSDKGDGKKPAAGGDKEKPKPSSEDKPKAEPPSWHGQTVGEVNWDDKSTNELVSAAKDGTLKTAINANGEIIYMAAGHDLPPGAHWPPEKGSKPSEKLQAAETHNMAATEATAEKAEDTKAGVAAAHNAAFPDRTPTKDASAWDKSMTATQKQAISGWTDGHYTQLREVALGKNTDPVRVAEYKALQDALKTAPMYNGPVSRGIKNLSTDAFDKLTSAKEIGTGAPSSFSKNVETGGWGTGSEVGKHAISFHVEAGHGGADIESHSGIKSEREVLVPAGHTFTVSHVEIHDRLTDQGGKYAIMHLVPTGTGGKPQAHI